MRYDYAYKTSDGIRHEASIDAESREAVFVALREQGIKAIKVVAADGSKANGEVVVRGVRKRIALGVAVVAALVAGVASYFAGRSIQVAETSPRHWLDSVAMDFGRPSERLLVHFARPGEEIGDDVVASVDRAFVDDFAATLREPLRIGRDDTVETVELKRVIEGLKAEARSLLRGGRDYENVLRFFVQRQKTEAALRRQIVAGVDSAPPAERSRRRREAAEMLETLGFRPLPAEEGR